MALQVPGRFNVQKVPQPPKMVPPTEDQVSKYMSLYGMLLIQTRATLIMSPMPISGIISTLNMRKFHLRNFLWFSKLYAYLMEKFDHSSEVSYTEHPVGIFFSH